ncbi:hypothetical protein THII_3358 [Thioploca ingrica]|uniref:DUF5615 domain-containing protein n=1 Tax=Thioploca ingrica TaxID=40754 RepID=A0A090APZ2_9GAMM|nr:hypothetical protein THII_3358 [Thioploca ingrica]
MKFLVDAQLPRRLVYHWRDIGFKAMHTLDLPHGNRTQDDEINTFSTREQWIVVSKDRDFVDSFLIQGKPYKLLLITTGNITNAALETLLVAHLEKLVILFEKHSFIELNTTAIIIHI